MAQNICLSCSDVELNVDVSTLWHTYSCLREGRGQSQSVFWIETQSVCKDDGTLSITLQQIDRGYRANAPDMDTVLLPQLQQDQFWHLPVRCVFSREVASETCSYQEYSAAFKAAENRVSRLYPVIPKELVLGRATCYFFPVDGDGEHVSAVICCNTVTFAMRVTIMDSQYQLCLKPTPLLRNLSGTSGGWAWREPQMGCVIHVGGDQFSLVYADDELAFSSHRVCGIWISGIKDLRHPFVWAACMHFLHGVRNLATYHNAYILLLYPGDGEPVDSRSWYPAEDGSSAKFTHLGCCERLSLTKQMQGNIKLSLEKDKYGEASLAFHKASREFHWPMPQMKREPLALLHTARPMTSHPQQSAEDGRPRQVAPQPHEQILKIQHPSVPDISMFCAPRSASDRQGPLWPDDTCDISGLLQTGRRENHSPRMVPGSNVGSSGKTSHLCGPTNLPMGLSAKDLVFEKDSTSQRVLAWLNQQDATAKKDHIMQTNAVDHVLGMSTQSSGLSFTSASSSHPALTNAHGAGRIMSSGAATCTQAVTSASEKVNTAVSTDHANPAQEHRITSSAMSSISQLLGQMDRRDVSSAPWRGSTSTHGSSSADSGCSSKNRFSFPTGQPGKRLSASSSGHHLPVLTNPALQHERIISSSRQCCSDIAPVLGSVAASARSPFPSSLHHQQHDEVFPSTSHHQQDGEAFPSSSHHQRHTLPNEHQTGKQLDEIQVDSVQAINCQHKQFAQIDCRQEPRVSPEHPLVPGHGHHISPDRETLASQSSIGIIAGPPGSSVSQQIPHWRKQSTDSLASPVLSTPPSHTSGLQQRVEMLCEQLTNPTSRPNAHVVTQATQLASTSTKGLSGFSTTTKSPSLVLDVANGKRHPVTPTNYKPQQKSVDYDKSMQVRLLQEKYLPQASRKCPPVAGHLQDFPDKENLAALPINLSSLKDDDMTVNTRHWLKKLCQAQNV